MSKFKIQGGQKLTGEIETYGAKNAALKLLPACLLTDQECTISNVPDIEDVMVTLDLLKDLGASVEEVGKGTYKIHCKDIKSVALDPEKAAKIRSSIMFVGPLLARKGEAIFPHPGGDVIGKRPIDIFLDGFKAMGVEIEETKDSYHLRAKQLKGTEFVFPRVSVSVTENLILASVLAEGETRLINAAMEPETNSLVDFLRQCGAQIEGGGTPFVKVKGVSSLSGAEASIIPDRLECGTFVILGVLTNSEITVKSCNPEHVSALRIMLEKIGAECEWGNDYVSTKPHGDLKSINLVTHEYPGFATDLQAPFTVLLTQTHGQSLVHETIFDGRLFYTDTLSSMGANVIMCDPHRVVINGPSKLYGRAVVSPDIRAGMALVLAGIVAEGETTIDNIYQIDRGYAHIEERLTKLGVSIKREE